jgi:CRP-like cAMP-binding protein
MADADVLSLLSKVVPFSFLRRPEKERLAACMRREIFPPGQVILKAGGVADFDVFLIQGGSVETVEAGRGAARRVTITEEGHFFGEREALLGLPRRAEYRALDEVTVWRLGRDEFLSLFRYKAFALAFGGILRERQGIFSAFERFKAELRRGITRGYVNIAQLMPR